MDHDKTIDQALEIVEKKEKSLSIQRKGAYFLLVFSLIYGSIFVFNYSSMDSLSSMSEELNSLASTDRERVILEVVDSKIQLALSKHKIESSLMPVFIGVMLGSGIGILLSAREKNKEAQVLKNVIKLIGKNS